jgi:hypothetical protein
MALKTPILTSECTMHVYGKDSKEILVFTVAKTVWPYDIRCIDDLHAIAW